MSHGQKIARNASVVAASTLVSRVLGFLRDVVVAFALGAGLFADAFFVAFRVPNLLRRLFAEGSMTMAFIPVFSRLRKEQGDEEAFSMARSALAWLLAILGAISLLALPLAKPIVMAIAPGFADNPGLFDLTARLLRICFPYIVLVSAVGLCMGVLNSMDHFLAPSISPALLNVGLIGAALFGWALGFNVAVCMAWGALLGGLGQWFLQQPFLKARGFSWRGRWSWRHPGVIRMGLLMLPTVFGAAVYQINILLGTLLASFLPLGSISYLYYADRLVEFPLGVFGLAVSTAALPSLSVLAAEKDWDGFSSALRSAQGLSLFIALPSMAGLMALARPIIDLLFQRGAFTPDAVTATALALVAYAAGLPFIALSRALVAGFYALEDTRTPVLVGVLCLVVNIGLGLLLMGPMAHVGLALAVSVAAVVNFLLLHLILSRRLGACLLRLPAGAKSLALSAAMGLCAYLSAGLSLWYLLIPAWAAAYVLAAMVLRLEEAGMFLDMIKARLRRGRG
ncbi:MAG: murein biosynthesis integral membrane protein MurJ [Desulfovibrionaceae bacterium]|nr:murein biosynthesis integral membrane protein MurJ [Desulfovibrionaceae bacterium]